MPPHSKTLLPSSMAAVMAVMPGLIAFMLVLTLVSRVEICLVRSRTASVESQKSGIWSSVFMMLSTMPQMDTPTAPRPMRRVTTAKMMACQGSRLRGPGPGFTGVGVFRSKGSLGSSGCSARHTFRFLRSRHAWTQICGSQHVAGQDDDLAGALGGAPPRLRHPSPTSPI